MREIPGMSILITGGGSGIGAGAAAYFAERGAKVTICGRRLEKINEVAGQIGGACHAVQADITDEQSRKDLVSAAVEHGDGLHALISNAGNMYRGPITELDESSLLNIFHVNVVAGMMLAGLAVPHLEREGGAIIYVGSIHTRRAYPGASPYAATKGALQTLTRVLAAELGAKGIRVNCVVPGAVFTEINQRAGLFDDATAKARLDSMATSHALGRIGTTQEIAEAMDYLIRGEWTTGAVVDVDGGLGLGLTDA